MQTIGVVDGGSIDKLLEYLDFLPPCTNYYTLANTDLPTLNT